MRILALLALTSALLPAMAQGPEPRELSRPVADGAKQSSKEAVSKFDGSKAEWPPNNIDPHVPPVHGTAHCSLSEVQTGASERIKELVANLPEFTATEQFVHQEFTRGHWGAPQFRKFDYMVEMKEVLPGHLVSQETRNGTRSAHVFPAELADVGLPTLALAFHPYLIDDYQMNCEGLGDWHGQPAWQVRFQQRADRPARLRAYVVNGQMYPVSLKGRAWISPENFQVMHLESDLVVAVPEIRLLLEHVSVEYRPVRFKDRDIELWLPQTAEVHMDFRGHRFRRRHSFSEFYLFAVDVNQKVNEPKSQ